MPGIPEGPYDDILRNVFMIVLVLNAVVVATYYSVRLWRERKKRD